MDLDLRQGKGKQKSPAYQAHLYHKLYDISYSRRFVVIFCQDSGSAADGSWLGAEPAGLAFDGLHVVLVDFSQR